MNMELGNGLGCTPPTLPLGWESSDLFGSSCFEPDEAVLILRRTVLHPFADGIKLPWSI